MAPSYPMAPSFRSHVALSSAMNRAVILSNKRLVFASEWYFFPEGQKVVKERFEVALFKRGLVSILFFAAFVVNFYPSFLVATVLWYFARSAFHRMYNLLANA